MQEFTGWPGRGKEAAALASRLNGPCILAVTGLADPGPEETRKRIEQEAGQAGLI